MSKCSQELIDQFNRQEQRRRRFQWRKIKRRTKFPKLGAFSHAILDLKDEVREKKRQVDCTGINRIDE